MNQLQVQIRRPVLPMLQVAMSSTPDVLLPPFPGTAAATAPQEIIASEDVATSVTEQL
jgi:hypothetical protein